MELRRSTRRRCREETFSGAQAQPSRARRFVPKSYCSSKSPGKPPPLPTEEESRLGLTNTQLSGRVAKVRPFLRRKRRVPRDFERGGRGGQHGGSVDTPQRRGLLQLRTLATDRLTRYRRGARRTRRSESSGRQQRGGPRVTMPLLERVSRTRPRAQFCAAKCGRP